MATRTIAGDGMKVADILTAAVSADRGQKGQKQEPSLEMASSDFADLLGGDMPDAQIVVEGTVASGDGVPVSGLDGIRAMHPENIGPAAHGLFSGDAAQVPPGTSQTLGTDLASADTSGLTVFDGVAEPGHAPAPADTLPTVIPDTVQIAGEKPVPDLPGLVAHPANRPIKTSAQDAQISMSAVSRPDVAMPTPDLDGPDQTTLVAQKADVIPAPEADLPAPPAQSVATTAQPVTHISGMFGDTKAQLGAQNGFGVPLPTDMSLPTPGGETAPDIALDLRLSPTSPSQPGAITQVSAPQKAIVHQIVVALSKPHDGTIQIRLDPPELGRITLHISAAEMGTTATVSADRPEVLDLLRRNEALLTAELKDAGFNNLAFDFSRQSPEDHAPTPDAEQLHVALPGDTADQSLNAQPSVSAQRAPGSTSLDIRL